MDRFNALMIFSIVVLLCSCEQVVNKKGTNTAKSENEKSIVLQDENVPTKNFEVYEVDPQIIEIAESREDTQLVYQVVEWSRVDERLSAIEDELKRLRLNEELEGILEVLASQSKLDKEVVDALSDLSKQVNELLVITESRGQAPSTQTGVPGVDATAPGSYGSGYGDPTASGSYGSGYDPNFDPTGLEIGGAGRLGEPSSAAGECSEGITFTNTWLSLLFSNRLRGRPAARRLSFNDREEAEMFMFLMDNVYPKDGPGPGGLQYIKLRFERGDFDYVEPCFVITNSGDEVEIDVVQKVKNFVADKF